MQIRIFGIYTVDVNPSLQSFFVTAFGCNLPSLARGVVRNFNPWVLKLCLYQFGYFGCKVRRYLTYADPYFLQNPWVPFHTLQKSAGSVEPMEPTLTTPLLTMGRGIHIEFDEKLDKSMSCN